MHDDAVSQSEHEHAHLNRLVDGLRESTQECLRGEAEPIDLRADWDEFLRVAQDELFEHFEHEESGLFPFVLEAFPETAATIAALEEGHDRMCGLLSRMDRMVSAGDETFADEFDALIALFARFDATYVRHAREEGALLRSLASSLTPEQRATISALLAEL